MVLVATSKTAGGPWAQTIQSIVSLIVLSVNILKLHCLGQCIPLTVELNVHHCGYMPEQLCYRSRTLL